MADKSPRHTMSKKKSTKTLKEKRRDKKAAAAVENQLDETLHPRRG